MSYRAQWSKAYYARDFDRFRAQKYPNPCASPSHCPCRLSVSGHSVNSYEEEGVFPTFQVLPERPSPGKAGNVPRLSPRYAFSLGRPSFWHADPPGSPCRLTHPSRTKTPASRACTARPRSRTTALSSSPYGRSYAGQRSSLGRASRHATYTGRRPLLLPNRPRRLRPPTSRPPSAVASRTKATATSLVTTSRPIRKPLHVRTVCPHAGRLTPPRLRTRASRPHDPYTRANPHRPARPGPELVPTRPTRTSFLKDLQSTKVIADRTPHLVRTLRHIRAPRSGPHPRNASELTPIAKDNIRTFSPEHQALCKTARPQRTGHRQAKSDIQLPKHI